MRVRIKFTKEKPVKYLGHLDILRFFQKCFVRAGVKMLYSEGFNPHQKLSFALPLGVGITSRCEFLDADTEPGQDLFEIKENLNSVSGPGFCVLDIKEVSENAESLMSAVKYASYEIFSPADNFENIEEFMRSPSIEVVKETKKGSRLIDIKPMIYNIEQDKSLKLFLSAGSENNLKPELLLNALCNYNKKEYKREDYEIIRTGLFGPGRIDLTDYQTI